MLLKTLAIVVGALVLVTRGIGVVAPEAARRMIKGLLARQRMFLILLVVLAVLGAVVIGAARISLQETCTWQAVVMLVFGIVMASGGLVNLAFKKLMPAIAAKIVAVSDTTLRLLCLAGVVLGAFLIWMGTTMS